MLCLACQSVFENQYAVGGPEKLRIHHEHGVALKNAVIAGCVICTACVTEFDPVQKENFLNQTTSGTFYSLIYLPSSRKGGTLSYRLDIRWHGDSFRSHSRFFRIVRTIGIRLLSLS